LRDFAAEWVDGALPLEERCSCFDGSTSSFLSITLAGRLKLPGDICCEQEILLSREADHANRIRRGITTETPAMKLIGGIALALAILMLAEGVSLIVALALLFAFAVWLALPLFD
jgi:hypothetical protein